MKTYVLELDGKLAGTLSAVSASSLTMSSKEQGIFGKAASNPTEIVIAIGTGMSAAFYKWLGSFGNIRKNGSIIIIEGARNTRLNFTFATITQVVFPELGSSNSGAGSIKVTLRPETVTVSTDSTKIDLGVYTGVASSWVVKNFRFSVDGFKTDRVSSVSSLTWGLKIVEEPIGNTRSTTIRTATATISNLAFTLPIRDADPFTKWFKDALMKPGSADYSKSAEITYLASNLKTEYFGVKLKDIGVSSLRADAASATVVIYCEDLSFAAAAPVIK